MRQLVLEGFNLHEKWYLINERNGWSVLNEFDSLDEAIAGAAIVYSDLLSHDFEREEIQLTIGRVNPDILVFAYTEEPKYPNYVLTQAEPIAVR